MRLPGIVATVLVLAAPSTSAQEWTTCTDRLDRFEDMLEIGSTIGMRCHQRRDGSACLFGFTSIGGAAESIFD